MKRARGRPPAMMLFAVTILLSLSGCGAGDTNGHGASSAALPPFVTEPFSHRQELIQRGGDLIVTDGCAACHLESAGRKIAPSFASFAGQRITLTSGRRALVDEHLISEGLLHPGKVRIKGYDPEPMLAAIKRLDFVHHPQQVAALAAFIEEIGPEPG